MKVLLIANTFPSPDTPKVAPFNIRAAKNLIDSGIDLHIFHLRSWKPNRKISATYVIDGIKITAVALPFYAGFRPKLRAWNVNFYKRLFYRYIKKKVKLSEFNIIHTVGAAHAGIIGSYIKSKTGIPHIAQCIGSDVNVVLPEIKKYRGIKGFENHVDIFSGNSHSLANQAKFLYPEKPTAVIYRGIDLNIFKPDSSKLNPNKIIFSYLGGFSAGKTIHGRNEKGALTLLRSWKDLIESHPDLNICLHFGGPRVTREEVEKNVKNNPENLKIKIIGHLDRTEVKAFLQESHVLIIPSMWDGLPNAGTEAAACGCAIIGSTAGGIPEIVERGNLGILFSPGDSNALKESILKLATDSELLQFYRNNSRPFMEKHLDASQFAPGYINLYNQLVK